MKDRLKVTLRVGLLAFFALVVTGCRAPKVQSAVSPTATQKASLTSTPSPTPTATQTPQPTATAQTTWQLFSGEGFTILLPDTHEGGSSPEAIQTIIDSLRNGGSNVFADLAQQNKDRFKLFAIDDRKSLIFRTSMNVIAVQNGIITFAPISILVVSAKYQLTNLLPGAEVIEEGSFDHPQLGAYRLVYRVDSSVLGFDEDVQTGMVQYLIRKGSVLWIISFSVPLTELDSRMADFDTSAASFSPAN